MLTDNGVEGLKQARRRRPDLVILDVIMPGMDGYAVSREMRRDPLLQDLPILFLTAKVKDEDKIAGFMAGADDYMTKPFNLDELILRIRAILRRAARRTDPNTEAEINSVSNSIARPPGFRLSGANSNAMSRNHVEEKIVLVVENYSLDTRSYELTTPTHGKIRLTPVQFDLLQHLMNHPGEIFSPTRLLDEVWDYPSDSGSPDLVRVHIKNLRERIEVDPRAPSFIRTVPGYGYIVGSEA